MILLWLGLAFAQEPAPQPTTDVSAGMDDDPRRMELAVSRGRGRPGGVVILASRVIPESTDPEVTSVAATLQERMTETARRAAPMAAQDVRPDPERVCPRKGCRGASVSVLIGHQDGGCVAVALIAGPGEVPTQLVPLAGRVELSAPSTPFRAPPESVVTVREFVPCSRLPAAVDDTAAVLALRKALEGPAAP